jgi:hypothetical protein
MLLNSLQGEIAHMNTLSNDLYRGFKAGTVPVGTHYCALYTEFTKAAQNHIWLYDLKGTEVKSKFDKPFEPVRPAQPINGI